MTIREQTQAMEREMLAPWAALSSNTRGRQRPEEECEMRTPLPAGPRPDYPL